MRRFRGRLAAAVLAAVLFVSGQAWPQVGGQAPFQPPIPLPATQGGTGAAAAPAAPVQTPGASQLNPTGTSNLTYTMMGLGTAGGGNLALTPRATGKVYVTITGTFANSLIADGAQVALTFGTGAAPSNGAAFSNGCSGAQCGTQVGGAPRANGAAAGQLLPFTVSGVMTGLALGTPYWFDLSLASMTAGTATITNAGATIMEISP